MNDRLRLSYIVPTAGRSPYLQACIEALSPAQGAGEILLAVQEDADISAISTPRTTKVIPVPTGAGFAGACNRALAATDCEYVALVNDDALPEPDWAEALVSALDEDPQLGAVQGTNVELRDSKIIDGCGIAWNRDWQAIQLDRGNPSQQNGPCREIFGVSGTAAILRRQALDKASLSVNQFFDSTLGTYYEDVELACRLRGSGYCALHVPDARVRHAGGTSSSGNPSWRWSQIYGNRILVLARLWGRLFPPRLPGLLTRDLVDLVRACARLNPSLIAGIVRGWGRAAHHIGAFGHRGGPLLSLSDLRRFQLLDARRVQIP